MSQESASVTDEVLQQRRTESVDHVTVDSDDHTGSSHTVEMFGVGLAVGLLAGGVAGVLMNSLALGMMAGLPFGVLLGLYMMERR